MAYIASDIIVRARRVFSELPEAMALGYLNEVHSELLSRYQLREDTLDISLVAGTPDYDLDETAILVLTAKYLTDSGTTRPRILQAFNEQEWDKMRPGWRDITSGIPTHYSIGASLTSATIRFYPAPATSTATGYPIVTLDIRRSQTLGLTDTIPNGMLNGDVYIYGIRRRWAEEKHQDQLAVWLDRERDATLKLEKYLNERLEQQPAKILPAFGTSYRTK